MLYLLSTRRSPTQCQTPARIRWSSPFLSQPFPASVFPVQPTAPIVNLMALFPILSSQTCQTFSASPQTPDFLRPIFHSRELNFRQFCRLQFSHCSLSTGAHNTEQKHILRNQQRRPPNALPLLRKRSTLPSREVVEAL